MQHQGNHNTLGSARPDQVAQVTEKAKQQVQQASQQIKEQAGEQVKETTQQVQKQAKAMLQQRKEQAAGELNGIAQALRAVGNQDGMAIHNQERIAGYADQLAGQIDHAARYLAEKEVDQIMRDAQGFARRQPGIFLGGALALGLVLGRFLRTSVPSSSSGAYGNRGTYGYPERQYGGYGATGYDAPPAHDDFERYGTQYPSSFPSAPAGGE
ncbi:MAG: hypothetical protein DCC55_40845 [Chloroflexi bacterium]|nr:MAG: hypothetical protein DCC55_40845 [Chloroflexota bacterium]